MSAALESQSLVLTNPGFNPTATFTFVTFVGEAFDLSANFLDAPAGVRVSCIALLLDLVC